MSSSGSMTPVGGAVGSSDCSPTSTTGTCVANSTQPTSLNSQPMASTSAATGQDQCSTGEGQTSSQQEGQKQPQQQQQQQQIQKFPSRLMALLMRPQSPPTMIGKPVRVSPVPVEQPLPDPVQEPVPSPAAPGLAKAQDPAPTPPVSVFLHSSYGSLRASAEAHLRINSNLAPALPLDTGTVNNLLNGLPKANWGTNPSPTSQQPQQQQQYTHVGETLSSIPEEVPAKRRCTEAHRSQPSQTLEREPSQSPISAVERSNSLTPDLRRKRFLRTRQALEKSGLLEITMQTANLINENKVLDNEIEQLKRDTELLLRSVLQQQQLQSQSYMLAKYANVFMNGN